MSHFIAFTFDIWHRVFFLLNNWSDGYSEVTWRHFTQHTCLKRSIHNDKQTSPLPPWMRRTHTQRKRDREGGRDRHIHISYTRIISSNCFWRNCFWLLLVRLSVYRITLSSICLLLLRHVRLKMKNRYKNGCFQCLVFFCCLPISVQLYCGACFCLFCTNCFMESFRRGN